MTFHGIAVMRYEASVTKTDLFNAGMTRIRTFCKLNGIECPAVHQITPENWYFDVPAYYRPDTEQQRKRMGFGGEDGLAARGYGPGINICLARCSAPATAAQTRAYSWPAGVSDRTPYGVLAHELGHHLDWLVSEKKGSYGGDFSVKVMTETGEPPVTSYAPNPWEWWAEMARVYVTNPDLLRLARPLTCAVFRAKWELVPSPEWEEQLRLYGEPPARIVASIRRKL